MTRRILAAGALLLALAGCASDRQPSNVENACAIFDSRPHWERDVLRAESKWGAPAHVAMAIIWKESSFQHDAAPSRRYAFGFIPMGRRSSAYGFPQALDGTWDWYVTDTGNRGAVRDDFGDAADFVGWYMRQSRTQNGIDMNDAYNQYLAYHEGHAGWRRKTYRSKSWLTGVAKDVQNKSEEYRRQIARCT
ncbi:MAG: transglycosylase SLT domain-containing protein [Pseudomonadota bacterium]